MQHLVYISSSAAWSIPTLPMQRPSSLRYQCSPFSWLQFVGKCQMHTLLLLLTLHRHCLNLCVSGAVLLALYRGPSLIGLGGTDAADQSATSYPAQWLTSTMLGCGVETWYTFFMADTCWWSFVLYTMIQAQVVIKYPANLSLTVYSYAFAAIYMVLTGVFATNGLHEWQ
ncbi:hypothetical protein PR202_gn00041 [Eleusine coracana subsp. coracana]|uniref:Uncharacterized protein n=1 Tax=Eleusine coracana subsp. coracana TaxID=191504 RepID=A0AAV5F9T9_ELECO|nr:hypothetical protein PR202_gb20083 [Eleusine coracana subsp. coracana]GJN40744.1 hypothetical protein PR202_gn00041 [Eleusine coracana subsp. coracana]